MRHGAAQAPAPESMHKPASPAFLLLLATWACSDPSSPGPDPAEVLPTPTGPVTAVVAPGGGSVSATTDEGVTVTIEVPAGAVAFPTEVTLRPVEPAAGEHFGIRIEPASLRLFTPFRVSAVVPSAVPLEGVGLTFGSLDGRLPVPTEIDPVARTVSSEALTLFGLGGGSPPISGPLASSMPADANQLGGGTISCAAAQASAQQSFEAFLQSEDASLAISAALAVGALLQKSGCDPSAFLTAASSQACQAATAALAAVGQEPTDGYGDFQRQVERIVAWASTLQLVAPDCAAMNSWSGALDGEIAAYVAFHESRLAQLAGSDFGTFQDLRQEALTALDAFGTAATLSLDEGADKIMDEAFHPTVDRMREVAFDLCRSDAWHYPLSRMTSTGFFSGRDIVGETPPRPGPFGVPPDAYALFSNQDVFEDLQHCATELEIASLGFGDSGLASASAGTQGTAGSHVAEVTLETFTRGSLRIEGELAAFTCWNGVEADSRVDIALNGVVVHTLQRASDAFLGESALELDIEAIAETAGVTPQEGVSHELVFTRERSECDERLWGEPSFDIVTATLDWVNPTVAVSIEHPDTVLPGVSSEAAVRVGLVDPAGDTAYVSDVDVSLTVTGGSGAALSGKTDAEGWFRTEVTAGQTATSLTIQANAISSEGASGTATHAAAIKSGAVLLVRTRYRVIAHAWVAYGQDPLDEEEQLEDVFDELAYQSDLSASASHDVAGSSSATGSAAGTVTVSNGDEVVSIVANGQASLQKEGLQGSPSAEGFGIITVHFDVVGSARSVRIEGSIFARPQTLASAVETESARAQIGLRRVSPSNNATLEEIVIVESWNGDPPPDVTVTLQPGRYEFSTNARVSTGAGCSECSFTAESSVQATMTVE